MSQDVSALQQIGVELGSGTYGTASSSFTRGLLAGSLANNMTQSVDRVPEVSGSLATRRVGKGPLDFETSLSTFLDVGSNLSAGIGDFLAALMGTDTGSLAAGVYTHKFTVSESAYPPWLNIYSTKDYVPKQILGFAPSQIKFSIKAGESWIPVEISGSSKDEADLVAAQTLTYASAPLMVPSNITALTIGGTNVLCTDYESIDITLKNEQEKKRVLCNSRTGVRPVRKGWSVEIAIAGFNPQSETLRTAFKDVTASSFGLTLTDSGSKTIQFAFPETYAKSYEGPSISDQDLLKVNVAMIATGTLANQYIEIKNSYAKNYGTGVTIV